MTRSLLAVFAALSLAACADRGIHHEQADRIAWQPATPGTYQPYSILTSGAVPYYEARARCEGQAVRTAGLGMGMYTVLDWPTLRNCMASKGWTQ